MKSNERDNVSNDKHATMDTKGRCKANGQKVDTKGRGSESDENHQAPVRGKKEAKVETKWHFKKGIQKWIQKGAAANATKSIQSIQT